MKVLGIDPGTAVLGYGVVERDAAARLILHQCGTITTRSREPLPARLRVLYDGTARLLAAHAPDVMALESAFYGRNIRTTVVLSQARGVLLLAAEQAGVPIVEYTPATVKKAIVGRGAALKPQVGYMVAQLLRLAAPPAPHDAADGVALALTHLLAGSRTPLPGVGGRKPVPAVGSRKPAVAGGARKPSPHAGRRKSAPADTGMARR